MITTAILEAARRTTIDPAKASTDFNGVRFDVAEAIAVDAALSGIAMINNTVAAATDDPELAARLETMVLIHLVAAHLVTNPGAARPLSEAIYATITTPGVGA